MVKDKEDWISYYLTCRGNYDLIKKLEEFVENLKLPIKYSKKSFRDRYEIVSKSGNQAREDTNED